MGRQNYISMTKQFNQAKSELAASFEKLKEADFSVLSPTEKASIKTELEELIAQIEASNVARQKQLT